MKYWKYLQYVLRHKWFVFQEGRKLDVPLWQLIIHDWSKFLPDEFFPYTEWFYGYNGGSWYAAPDSCKKARLKAAFDIAWLKHQHRNPHHWQHWILQEDSGKIKVLPMPGRFQGEMLADWRGAGRAINGKDDTKSWYENTKAGRKLHVKTQEWVEANL